MMTRRFHDFTYDDQILQSESKRVVLDVTEEIRDRINCNGVCGAVGSDGVLYFWDEEHKR